MKTKRSQEGLLIIDHSASPGTEAVPEGKVVEAAIVTCAHCQRQVVLNPLRTRAREYCPKCDRYVCDLGTPGCPLECRNYEKYLDDLQEQLLLKYNLGEV